MATKTETPIVCANCHAPIVEDEHTIVNGDYICDTCLEDDFVTCTECGAVIHTDDSSCGDGDPYCENCFHEIFVDCVDCGDTIFRDRSIYSEVDNSTYCDACYSERFTTCDNCGCELYRDDISYCERTGEYLCEDCFAEADRRSIHPYSYKPYARFFGRGQLFFGVELETENMGTEQSDSVAEQLEADYDFLYCKDDGSISEGFELVTHPFSYEWYREKGKKYFDDILRHLANLGFRSYRTDTCGIHIHLSKRAFGSIQLYKWLKFFYENPGFVTTISQRKPRLLEQWASLTKDENETLMYKAIKKKGCETTRYVAINLANDNTIEIRIFRGTLNNKSFHKNIEFLMALYDYTNKESLDRVSPNNFIRYVSEHKTTYKNLFEFLEVKGLIQTTEGVKICA